MDFTGALVRFAVTPAGAVLDQLAVAWTGHSFVAWAFAKANGVEYNRPLLLTTIGARSGKKRRAVLPYFEADLGPGQRAIVGSRGGMRSNPHWVHNLREHPQVWIRVDRRTRAAHARETKGEERARLWEQISARAPVYLEYQERCARYREIPVIVVSEVG